MAELTTDRGPPTSSCCSAETQTSCCEPSEKTACCGESAAGGSCGCSAGQKSEAQALHDIRDIVRERYAQAARAAADTDPGSCGCAPLSTTDEADAEVFGAVLYDESQSKGATAAAVAASLGCGVPTAVADLHPGETVLDLGSGAGTDVLISAQRVGATGRAIGLDMTDEMLELARSNATQAGVRNIEFVKGYIEEIPLPDASVDVIVSNCVLNLSADKPKVLAEAARVLKPGGRFAVSDVIADPDMNDATRADMAAYTGCIAGALTAQEFCAGLAAAGFTDIEIRETHRVHEHAGSAIIRARKPIGESIDGDRAVRLPA
jgi:arsenite methyltransferase